MVSPPPPTLNTLVILIPVALFLSVLFMTISAGNFTQDFDIMWGFDRAKILDDGEVLTLSLDNSSGSGFQSTKKYLFGSINMQLQLVSGNSAGVVTTYYLSSNDSKWDEIDFGFLGNLSGDPYIVYTNVVTEGSGNREQQFYLWFNPTTDFHTYSILWNPKRIVFAVDGAPIRVFKNLESMGIAYPKQQPMRIYCSLCNSDVDWATRGGLVKTNWSEAPFTVSYRNFDDDKSCIWSNGTSSCNSTTSWLEEGFDSASLERLRWVQNNYMIYNYCNDLERFPQGLPPECDIY